MKQFFSLIALIILTGCQSESESQPELLKGVNEKFEALKEQFGNTELDSLAQEELEKLFVFEYKVHEFSSKPTSLSIETELARLGKERWECFYIDLSSSTPRAVCKRRPKTYLRYIPRVF